MQMLVGVQWRRTYGRQAVYPNYFVPAPFVEESLEGGSDLSKIPLECPGSVAGFRVLDV